MSCYRLSGTAIPSGDIVESTEHLHLEPVPRVVAESRYFVAEHAPGISAELRDVLMLLTSELVTNAVIHARTELEVGVAVTDRSVVVTVYDEDLGGRDANAARDGGWGLGLVTSLSEASDLERHPGAGRTAWFRISRDDKEPAA
jgi:two-component sensor histidine kinase